MSDVLYFACSRAGHFLVGPNGRGADCPAWHLYDIVAKLCPGYGGPYTTTSSAHVEGAAALHHKDGWTALAFWDRSVFTRGGCNSVFMVRGTHDAHDVVLRSREVFPSIWRRFTFKVKVGELVVFSPIVSVVAL